MQKEPVGIIYKEMVKLFLEQEGSVGDDILEKVTNCNSIVELESIVKMRQTIILTITGLTWRLKEHGSSLPSGYFDHVVYGRDTGNFNLEDIDDETYGDIVFYACEAIHDGAVKNSGKLFFSNDFKGDLSRFLPLPISGIEELERCYIIMSPIIQDLNIGFRWEVLKQFYGTRTENFLNFCEITNGSELVRNIRLGNVFYHAWPAAVSNELKHDEMLAAKVALSAVNSAKIQLANP